MTFKYNSEEERNVGAVNVSTVEKHGAEWAAAKWKKWRTRGAIRRKKSLFQSCLVRFFFSFMLMWNVDERMRPHAIQDDCYKLELKQGKVVKTQQRKRYFNDDGMVVFDVWEMEFILGLFQVAFSNACNKLHCFSVGVRFSIAGKTREFYFSE